MYQSEWTDKPMLHLFPHWNWLPGQEIDMWAYYNQADEVELYINGKSQGVRKKADSHQYHVMWRVKYEPGEVKAVSRKDGQTVCEQTIRTAGQPDHIRLSVDYQGKDLCFVCADIVDAQGNLCPWAENEVFFSGDVRILATDNGCQTSMERFTAPHRKAFFGKCLVVVHGNGMLKAQAIGLKDDVLTCSRESKP